MARTSPLTTWYEGRAAAESAKTLAWRYMVRAEPFVTANGRLERREGVTNVLVDRIARLERPSDVPEATVKHIEPRRVWSTQPEEESTAQLRALAPAANSFGRGRGG